MKDTIEGVQVVISSPLRRCLQSASLAFPGAARGLGPPIVCNDLAREAYGMHFPDKRGKKSDSEVGTISLGVAMRLWFALLSTLETRCVAQHQ